MNEADFVLLKKAPLWGPICWALILGSLDVKSTIPRFHGIWTNDMKNVMCYMQYVICYVQDVMCCVQYDKYDDACYLMALLS